jgi:choline-glycine betaine transporter
VDSGRVGMIQPALDFLFLVLLSGFGCCALGSCGFRQSSCPTCEFRGWMAELGCSGMGWGILFFILFDWECHGRTSVDKSILKKIMNGLIPLY